MLHRLMTGVHLWYTEHEIFRFKPSRLQFTISVHAYYISMYPRCINTVAIHHFPFTYVNFHFSTLGHRWALGLCDMQNLKSYIHKQCRSWAGFFLLGKNFQDLLFHHKRFALKTQCELRTYALLAKLICMTDLKVIGGWIRVVFSLCLPMVGDPHWYNAAIQCFFSKPSRQKLQNIQHVYFDVFRVCALQFHV